MQRSNWNMPRRWPALLMAFAVFFCILTASIALPIYIRPFYYMHIDALNLPGVSGFTADQIMEAYNEVLDYLTLPGREFGTGIMACSQTAQDHFLDCKVLFDLNAWILLISLAVIGVLTVMKRTGSVGDLTLGGKGAAWWGGFLALGLPLVVGALAALDFNRAFVIFHSIFFPGKDNWLFSWQDDQIIRVLPKQFFMNCAILIGVGIVTLSFGAMALEAHQRKQK